LLLHGDKKPMTMFAQHARPVPPNIRVGLIGTGKMGLQHLRAIKSLPQASIVGIADPSADADALRRLVPNGAAIVEDASTLLQQVKPDVVHIVTPPATHAALAVLALEAGSHVYLEKPFTPTRQDAEKVLDLARRRGLKVVAGHQCLFEEAAVRAERMMRDIGGVVHIESFSSFQMVRKTITRVEQCKDILPHAVYPLLNQLRAATGISDDPIQIVGVDARASGDVYALLRLGECTGILEVTLSGRPIEQYQHIVGTNGSLRADYVIGSVIRLTGRGAGVGVLFTPYRRAFQTIGRATSGFARLLSRRHSYPGLRLLIQRFYESIAEGTAPPMSPRSIVDTVAVCEEVGFALDEAERKSESVAGQQLVERESALPPVDAAPGIVLVTGGTGMLGRPTVAELRYSGFAVRAVARRTPQPSQRIPGVQYVTADLGVGLDPQILRDVSLVVHCAAETAGGKREHERNSIAATRNVIEAAARARVRRVVHVSSLAVLKPTRGAALDERAPVDAGNLSRGPYVWGKAESEVLAQRLGAELGVDVKVVRPGPLVDFRSFAPPGRLGREVGPYYVAVGSKRSRLSLCDVSTAARIIRSYASSYDKAPAVLNIIEGTPPTRAELVARLREARPDLRVVWFPGWLLWLLNGPLMLAQRLFLGMEPIDVYRAFASERYRTDLAIETIRRAGPSAS
jgi:predicted dehydrogenase/nucleoside-diphosphate-sugar epimerase